jgi:hypothetical protein
MRKLSSSDRAALIKLASSLPSDSSERRVILAGLQQKTASVEVNAPVTQSEVNAAMKALGLSSFKFHRNMKKGFQGGSFGPLTTTDAFLRVNQNTEDRVKKGLRSLGAEIQPRGPGFIARFNQGPDAFSYSLTWHEVPSGFDNPEYQTCWLIFSPR